MPRMRAAAVLFFVAACSRAPSTDVPAPWVPPVEPAWANLPKDDGAAYDLLMKEANHVEGRRIDPNVLRSLRVDATKLVAGEDAIAAAYDNFLNGDSKKPAYLLFGTLHDSRAQIADVVAIAVRMKSLWGLALEQFRTTGHWKGAPDAPSSDDADLAVLTRNHAPLDDGALWRLRERQMQHDHAAWKFDYLPALADLIFSARGASLPILGCDMPPEQRTQLTSGHPVERWLREFHCARSLRGAHIALAPPHAPDGGLVDDDEAPPERFAIISGADHAEFDGLPRWLPKTARIRSVRVLGGRPADAEGDESELAANLTVLDIVVVRTLTHDLLLLPDNVWGGQVERTREKGGEAPNPSISGLPRPNVEVTSDEAGKFSIGESSVDVGAKPEWLSTRSGHQAFITTASSHTIIGAIDVPDTGFVEVHVSPKSRSLRVVVHAP